MAIYYVDFVNGLSGANGRISTPMKDINQGYSAAVGGDEIRVAKTPYVNTGLSATWTNLGKNIVLNQQPYYVIDNCDMLATQVVTAANTTVTRTTTTFLQGRAALSVVFAAGFTTGKAFSSSGSLATTGTDLSQYSVISFMMKSSAAVARGCFYFDVYSNSGGTTKVGSYRLPRLWAGTTNRWLPVVIDTVTGLPSSVAAWGISCSSDPGTPTIIIDNICACKSITSSSRINHSNILCKPLYPSWSRSIPINRNDIYTPSFSRCSNRIYKRLNSGTSSTAQMLFWPIVQGLTAQDNNVIWQDIGPDDDLQFTIRYLDGLSAGIYYTQTLMSNSKGYYGTTQTKPLYKVDPVTSSTYIAVPTADTSNIYDLSRAGAASAYIKISGGWNLSTTAQDGVTWIDFQRRVGRSFRINNIYNQISNFGIVRGAYGAYFDTAAYKCNFIGNTILTMPINWIIFVNSDGNTISYISCYGNPTNVNGIVNTPSRATSGSSNNRFYSMNFRGGLFIYINGQGRANQAFNSNKIFSSYFYNTSSYAVGYLGNSRMFNCKFRDNTNDFYNCLGKRYIYSCSGLNIAKISNVNVNSFTQGMYFKNFNGTINDDRIYLNNAVAYYQNRISYSGGYCWRLNPTSSTVITSRNPAILNLGFVKCKQNVPTKVQMKFCRDSNSITGGICIQAFQSLNLYDYNTDIISNCQFITRNGDYPAGVWQDLSINLPATDQNILIQIKGFRYGGTTNNVYFDMLTQYPN